MTTADILHLGILIGILLVGYHLGRRLERAVWRANAATNHPLEVGGRRFKVVGL